MRIDQPTCFQAPEMVNQMRQAAQARNTDMAAASALVLQTARLISDSSVEEVEAVHRIDPTIVAYLTR